MNFTLNSRIWLIFGPIAALFVYFLLPDHYISSSGEQTAFTHQAKATLSLLTWMAIWWLTEATNITVTALLPIALFPLLDIASIKDTTSPYASHIIFLFLGGFIIAVAIQRWHLDKRIALGILTKIGESPSRIVGGFMLTTALLSAFISNTATTAMMLPIGLSIITLVCDNQKHYTAFATCIMLSIAYAANIGGIATIIGTAPNLFVTSFIKDAIDTPLQQDISFLQWSKVGIPVVIILLPVSWWILSKVIYKIDNIQLQHSSKSLELQKSSLGNMSYEEKAVCCVFGITILLWLSRTFLQKFEISFNENTYMPFSGLTDASIAIFAAITLFLIPAKSSESDTILKWNNLRDLPWGILILLGGGLSLASAVKANGVTEFIGAQATVLSILSPLLILLVIVSAVVFLTELTSNTATTATLVPVLAAIAPALNMHPYVLIFPAAIAASCAFMLPIATPPNAIVFGSGHIRMQEMRKTGFWLNLICILILTTLVYVLSPYIVSLLDN